MRKLGIFVILFFLLVGCSHKSVKKEKDITLKKPARVYVPPFKYFKKEVAPENLKIVVDKDQIKYSYNFELMDLIVRDLGEKFSLKLKNKRKDYKPVSIEEVENVFETSIDTVPIKEIKRRFNVDYLLQGYIVKFVEREGNSFSVKTPAEVDFIMTIVDLNTNKILWKEEYHEKQESLSSNLLYFYKFFKRKGKWLTALELTENAFDKLVVNLP